MKSSCWFCFALVVTLQAPTAQAQVGSCKVDPVFSAADVASTPQVAEAFRRWQCAAKWASRSDARNAGVADDALVFGAKSDAPWDAASASAWQNSNCSATERTASYLPVQYSALAITDPISAKTLMECERSARNTEANRSLRCDVTETANALVFNSQWRKAPNDNAGAPQVQNFLVVNTSCANATDLANGKSVSSAGTALLCKAGDQAAAFFLQTSRGECVIAAQPRLTVTTGANAVLTASAVIEAYRVRFPANSTIVTQGFPLNIRATELEVGDKARIISFPVNTIREPMKPGSSAGPINITTENIRGGALTILNVGQPGGAGSRGPQGSPGPLGAPGKSRLPQWNQICGGLQFLCNNIPAGCTGGQDGTAGGAGSGGGQGYPGAPGGAGGDVTLAMPFDMRAGIKVVVDSDINGTSQPCGGICGGAGGQGGPGGLGGPGGAGGPGAPPAGFCGGTNNGPIGPTGPGGQPGPNGATGARGVATYQ